MKDGWFEYPYRVRYAENDRMGVVYHTHYINWFEIGRTEWVRQLGFTYADMERRGLFLPVLELEVSFHRPARYDEMVFIRTRAGAVSPLRIEFESAVRDEEGQCLAEGKTRHAWLNRDWKPARLDRFAPEWYEKIRQAST